MIKRVAISFLISSIVVGGLLTIRSMRTPVAAAQTRPGVLDPLPSLDGGLAGQDVGALVSPNLIRRLRVSAQPAGLEVESQELNPRTDYWQSWSLAIPLAFVPECVESRHGDEFMAIGRTAAGEMVVDRILMPSIPGSFYCERARSTAPLGTVVTTPRMVVLLRSPPFIPPADRSVGTPATVEEVYRGPALGKILELEVDPDGRYVILLTDQAGGSLIQVPLVPGGQVRTLVTASTAPALLNTVGITALEHGQDGRFYVLEGGAFTGYDRIWTWDSEGDGILDGWDHLPWESFLAAYPDNVWVEVHGTIP